MTRLIDADALLEELSKWLEPEFNELVAGVFKQITNAPTVQREGWVSVPIEPTEEMIAACKSTLESEESIAKVSYDNLNNIGWNPNLKELPADGTPLYLHPLYPRPVKRLDDADITKILNEEEGTLYDFANFIMDEMERINNNA